MLNKNDILQEIPQDELKNLENFYEKYKKEYPYIYSTIKMAIKWKKLQDNFSPKVLFLSPRNCWKEDGTFLIIFTYTIDVDVILFTFQESCQNLCDGIRLTKRKEFNQEVNFHSTHDKFTDLIKKACEDRNMINTLWVKSTMVRLPIEVALNYEIKCPPDVYIKPLTIKDAPKINDVWPRKCLGTEIKLAMIIKMNGGIGVYLKENDLLVAWVIYDQMGQIATLQTDANYKKKGYASLITKILSKKIAEEGVYPFAGIKADNYASLKMFGKLGFEEICSLTYFFMAPKPKNKL